VRADATAMPFQDKSFDAVLFAGSSHHFSDELLKKVLKECDRLSRRIIIIADIVKTKDQGRISRFLYSIDRGKHIRNAEALRGIIQTVLKYPNYHQSTHRTFPGFYTHAVFVFRK
jgi:ubiquinone/menaquinone biosynthesis C-methylase UbiE